MKEPPPAPLANDFQVVARFDNDPDPVTGERKGFTDAPSLVRAGDGSLLCAIPWSRKGKTVTRGEGSLSFHRRRDEGLTWERIDTCPGHGAWSLSVAAVCSVGDKDRRLTYCFHNFRPLPGAYNHFHIIYDKPSRLYWLLCNQPAGRLPRRNILALFCSNDAREWLCAGYPVIFPKANQAASYVTPLPDGDDLLIVSRTAWNSRNNHDNDLVTFHRVPEFRRLAEPFPFDNRVSP